jgi:hypothetical protein
MKKKPTKPPCLLSRRKRYLWGRAYMVRPALVKQRFGNGKRLIALIPILHRPNYYLVYVDNGWGLSNFDDDPLIDHLDDIYEQIAHEFGQRDEDDAEYCWPEEDFDGGSSWNETTEKIERKKSHGKR